MNKAILLGRITRDPEAKQAGNTTVTRFTLAVDRRFKSEGQPTTDFISCVAFGKTAEFISKYFKQGAKMAIEGRIQTGSYEKDGVKHYTTDVIVESVEFAESKKVAETAEQDGFIDVPDGIENELPFK
jgi:single-strand DNA-binding protein